MVGGMIIEGAYAFTERIQLEVFFLFFILFYFVFIYFI